MSDTRHPTPSPPPPAPPDGAAVDALRRAVRERDHLLLLHEALGEVERARTLEARLRVFVHAIQRIGFGRVAITLRDASLEPRLLVTAGLGPDEERELRESSAPGEIWRRRLAALEELPHLARLRISQSYYLEARDPWIADAFGDDALPSALDAPGGSAADWSPHDSLLVPLRGPDGRVVATLVLDDPEERARPSLTRVRTVELFGQQVAAMIEHARLYEESERQRGVSEALADVARAVNESLRLDEVLDRILRHAASLLEAEGAAVVFRRGEQLEVMAARGCAAGLMGAMLPIHHSVSGRAIIEGRPIIANQMAFDPRVHGPARDAAHARRLMLAPLVTAAGPVGAIAVINREAPFTDADAAMLQRLADQAAIALVNAQLFERHRALAERYGRVVETTRDGIVITDRARNIVFANRAAQELIGLPHESAGTPVSDTVPPELRDAVRAREDRAFAGEPQRYETVILRPDGQRRIVSISNSPLREQDEVTGIVASLRDITDERRARDAVVQSEARYRNLFETATDAIYTLDARGCFTSVNAATCEAAGRPREALLARRALELMEPREHGAVREHFKAALAGVARRYEAQLVRPDGERRLLSIANSPIRHAGQVIGVLGVARDITEARSHAQALVRSEARYTRLLESASDAIFTVDLDGLLTSANHSLARGVGRTRAELLGQPVVQLVDARDQQDVWMLFQETFTGRRRRGALRYLSAEGEIRYGSILTSPILEDEVVTGALAIVRDTTEERRLAEQLLQQEKLAAVGQLVSGVAHELNNPLAGVMAFSQLLLGGSVTTPEEQRRTVETIHDEAKRAARIVANLLTFARQRAPERTVTDLNRVVRDALELRSYAHRVQRVDVEVDLDPTLPLTWADPFQLQQVLLNVFGNAEQALDGWRGERRLRVRTSGAEGLLFVEIADTGPGIAPEHLGRVFDPFFTTKEVGEGTGLGLSISDGIVREHGGRIRVESRPGDGATFVLELPFVPPQPAEETPLPPPPAAAAAGGGALQLLVVDDEPALRGAVSAYLSAMGHTVHTAATGREALVRVAEQRYDAILLDLRMPDLSGDQVFARLRAMAPEQAAHVVFVTGDTQSTATRAFLAEAGRPVVRKPFLLDELGAVLLAAALPSS